MTHEAGAIVEVEVGPGAAFEIFTSEARAWWRRDLWGNAGTIEIEPGVGGRLLADGTREVGRVTAWEPGPRLSFTYGADDTEVDVRFEATESGTRVVLRHRGFTERDGGQWARLLAGFARQSLERALLRRLGEFLDAIAAGDTDFFEENLTEDARLIFPGPGNTYTKRECVAVMGDHPPYVKYELAEPRIVHSGGSTAVITHRATVLHTKQSAPRSLMVSSVLVRQLGSWRLALHQWTDC